MTGGVGLVAMLAYPIGFLIVVMGRGQLFTTNTVTPVAIVFERPGRLINMLRLWTVVFVFNLLGTMAFRVVVAYDHVLSPTALQHVLEEAAGKLEYGFWLTSLKAVFGGWIVALMVWLVASSTDSFSQAFVVFVLIFLIPAAGLTYCIAGSSEFWTSIFAGEVSLSEYLGGFLIPTTIGNVVGGYYWSRCSTMDRSPVPS